MKIQTATSAGAKCLARAAASLLKVDYKRTQGSFDLEASRDSAQAPPAGQFGPPAEMRTGDFEGNFAKAEVKLDETYSTPDQAHAMMEPHATIAKDGCRHESGAFENRGLNLHVISRFGQTVGSGFGNVRRVCSVRKTARGSGQIIRI
ncbi:molybdopterin cofactor-binding domain-containing protein [Dyadobacter pollutisoli]|uniref:Molybdopterin-dependent oxidoreductase n=1 Tax=Dyadobacter pollutisoli TaxID=2910158 RepID=A0A9E8NH27_9BACT|nr:molybdopterin cofactor-binding domain-containing protein [Dyadobacter pollutisoli]WAC14142.1 molybdopterin-dependent oxidoreductase [Dyadobacter pollutisoli]